MAATDGESSHVLASDETEPLIADPNKTHLKMKESVYMFMLFQAPISRRRSGSYWTSDVALAVALLTLNIVLQQGLTQIAGNHLVQKASDFQKTLVNAREATTPWAHALDETAALVGGHIQYVEKHMEETFGGSKSTAQGAFRCCNGAECADLGLPCCDRRGARPHRIMEPMRNDSVVIGEALQAYQINDMTSFLAVRKPAAKKKKAEEGSGDAARSSPSLCRFEGEAQNHTLVCSPPSYAFLNAWGDLDEDGDGMWTLEEARADEANLGCSLGLSVEEVFRSTVRGVQQDNDDTSANQPYHAHEIPLSIQERQAVPKDYFEWWKGLATLCVVHDEHRCGELVSRGIFDGAIAVPDHFAMGGVQDLDTALDYCQRLLRAGGVCEKTLPGAYMLHRSRVAEKCGVPDYTTGPYYVNPFDHYDVMQTVKIAYKLVDQYHVATTREFKLFMGLILFVWYAHVAEELKSVIELIDFLCSIPVSKNLGLLSPGMRDSLSRSRIFSGLSNWDVIDEDETRDNSLNAIDDIAWPHKVMSMIMVLLRLFVLAYMFHVGSNFIITNHKYDDLLFNAVALAFIFELPRSLYMFLVSDKMQKDLEGMRTADYDSMLPPKTSIWNLFFKKSVWGLVIIPLMVIAVVIFNDNVTTAPSLEALTCACYQQGDRCNVAPSFNREWWNQHWQDMTILFQSSYSPKV
jgi:hypothetical protein